MLQHPQALYNRAIVSGAIILPNTREVELNAHHSGSMTGNLNLRTFSQRVMSTFIPDEVLFEN